MRTYEVRNAHLDTLSRTDDLYQAMDWYTSLEHGHLALIENGREEVLFQK